ncbi:serine hydrolase domain-containing protein [Actinoplanes flavus]|uniref:Beta-lactamase family protein n=1 Tax=Actinoplanes flavus TaxID=2820290 RepID=A0ABS3UJ00_9ACTN|nr:serine hydrolase domain-containing protein [Actinoplanes flavus]MBO3738759.1 beta-lactamase family protein [Actinoplanes flavus]
MWLNRILVVTAVALAVPGAPAAAAPVVDTGAVERVVTGFADRSGYPGVAIAITKGDRVLHTAGYGDVTDRTLLPIASVSKAFTALAVMRLVEAGRLTLDTPVGEHLPGLPERITVRHLLQQTSGITDRTLREKSLPQPSSPAEAAERAKAATTASEPGSDYSYTNTNYHLLARLVEVVTGERFGDHLLRNVFTPLDMTDTVNIDQTPRDLPKEVKPGHVYAVGVSLAATEPTRFVSGSDGVVTTARDMGRWLTAQHGTRLLSAAGMTTMRTPSGPGHSYAMGWDTDDDGTVKHDGIWFTYTASVLMRPSGYGVAVLGDSGFSLATEGTPALARDLARLLEGGDPGTPAPTRLITDLVLLALTTGTVLLGIRRLRGAVTWPDRRLPLLRLVPRVLPVVLFVSLPCVLGVGVGGGRDITFGQVMYVVPMLVLWSAAAAAMNAATIVARGTAVFRRRRVAPAAANVKA